MSVSKESGPDPSWVQLRSVSAIIRPILGLPGSLSNPAEREDPHLLAVGMALPDGADLHEQSGRGPRPIASTDGEVTGIDMVAVGANPADPTNATKAGTSFAAPRVAGLAALAMQALGTHHAFDEDP